MKDDTGPKDRVSAMPLESDGVPKAEVPPMDVSRIIIQVLERIRQEIPTPRLLGEVVGLLAEWTGFEAVGMRLKEGDDYPYFQTRGMSEDFIRLENSLCPQGNGRQCAEKGEMILECVCGSVLQGRLDRTQPFIDDYGSFWTNSNSDLLEEWPEFRHAIRGNCVRNGYETSALIPMRLGGHTFGLLQFEDRRPGMLSREMLSALEAVAVNLALALSQRRYAEELKEEIVRRERIERRTQANNQVLRLMTEASGRQDFLDGIVKLVNEWTGCRCVGIRILDSEGNIPYGSYTGFSRGFWEKENWLSISKDACACTRVIAGEPEPQDIRCMTANGSFVLNNSRKLLGELQEVELTRFRGVCIDSGFNSIAIFPIRESGRIIGGIHIADERADMVSRRCVDLLEGLSRLLGEAIVKFNARDALDRQKELIQNIVDRIPVMLCFFNASGTLQFVNPEFERVFGWRLEEIQKDPLSKWFSDPQYCEEVRQYMKEATVEWRDFIASTKNGERIETSWSNVRMTDGSLIGIGIDLRERKRGQIAMERANRALRVLSESNYSLVQEHEEAELLNRVCRIIAETGGYALAWVGYPEESEEKRVIPVAKCGRAAAYLDSIRISWADSPLGRGSVGTAIRIGKPQFARDFGNEAHLSPWRELALSHGLHSNVTFPLIIHGEVIGALAIYASEGETIHDHEEEVQLLGSLADNLAYGIDAIRLHKEHERAEEELKTYTKRLQASNQALQDFASIASHDMQEPLRKVASFGNMLQQKYGPALGEEGTDFLHRMLNATDRMQSLLTSLLDYSRVTSRAEPFRKAELSKIIREVLSDLEVRIASTGGEVVLGELPVVQADPNQMRQLFQNLIGNGLKFHKKGSRPVVKVFGRTNKDRTCSITVEDNGIGFEERYLDKIFQPFHRLHGRSSHYEGTGMGLAICRRIVERHGGTITVKSRPGEGSAFTVTLPL